MSRKLPALFVGRLFDFLSGVNYDHRPLDVSTGTGKVLQKLRCSVFFRLNTSFYWTQEAIPDLNLGLIQNGSSHFQISSQGVSRVPSGILKVF